MTSELPSFTKMVHFKEMLTRHRKQVQIAFPCRNWKLEQPIIDEEMKTVIFRAERDIWAKRCQEHHYEWPSDWWQAFKDRWFPQWLKRRFPVKKTHVRIDVWEGYPNLPPYEGNQSERFLVFGKCGIANDKESSQGAIS